ncbi:MAG: gluconate 2-dehydrogenase subunit 3 family protein [Hyphomonadaceae bacterium]
MTEQKISSIVMIDRRLTLKWLAGAMAAGQLAACGDGAKGISWAEVEAIKAKGLGKDIDFANISVPWPLTMTAAELAITAELADLILPGEGDIPAPSKVGVPAFINEWVSAPYPDQHADRQLIIPGLAWLDDESKQRNGVPFTNADASAQKKILDDIAFKAKVKPGLEKPAEFFGRMRSLTLGAFYTTREGWSDVGYMGNTPGTGDYPGPTPEALAHIKGVIEKMGLTYTAP